MLDVLRLMVAARLSNRESVRPARFHSLYGFTAIFVILFPLPVRSERIIQFMCELVCARFFLSSLFHH